MPRKRGIIPRVAGECLKWEPACLEEPEIDPAFLRLPALERAAEALRFQTARLEYWLSPSGVIRAWLKLWLRTAAVLMIPGILLLPLALLLEEAADCAVYIRELACSLLHAAAFTILAVFAVRAAVTVWKEWNRHAAKQREKQED